MRQLRLLSLGMTIGGAALATAALVFDFGAFATLVGLMLIVAGMVKILTVAIWNGFAGLGPIDESQRSSPSSRSSGR